MLPSPDLLRTPLHFRPIELNAFKGSNLYGATLDREKAWRAEWAQCEQAVRTVNALWADGFAWCVPPHEHSSLYVHIFIYDHRERYLTASTYLSSRAFPSTVLSETPSLQPTPSSHPVLLPGVDSLNHARAHPVSWLVSASPGAPNSPTSSLSLSLVQHTPTPRGAELFNNYGAKPNAELILGYGFSLPSNPDDTIVLKIGGLYEDGSGAPQRTYEVGRDARGAGPVWDAVLAAVCQEPEDEMELELGDVMVEDELEAAAMLRGMAEDLFERLPVLMMRVGEEGPEGMRPEVDSMLKDYLKGMLCNSLDGVVCVDELILMALGFGSM